MKPIAWSHSALTSFETCPKRHYLTRISKEVPDPLNEAALWGNTVHKVLEQRLSTGQALPADFQYLEPLAQTLLRRGGTRLIEKKLAIDANFKPVGWVHPTTWCRSIVDVGLVANNNAVALDWKTGKRKPDSGQLRLTTAMVFAHYPHVEQVTTGFIWLQEKMIDSESFTREQIAEIWEEFLPRVKRLELAHANKQWDARPSGLCGAWCPVTKKHCEFGK